jgi:hypothetical protein
MTSATGTRTAGRTTVRIIIAVVLILLLAFTTLLTYANIIMQGKRAEALKVFHNQSITVTSNSDWIVLAPREGASGTGLVFIPGAKVDPYAYMYKLSGIVQKTGATVVITKPTLNLAFFDQRPLDFFTAAVPKIHTWFVGGHSLGGVRACQLAEGKDVAGLVLFGSYCANDLSKTSLKVLSISGSRDGLTTPQKVEDNAHLLPADTTFDVIKGANHASFGDYGHQDGDGTATVSSSEVRREITKALAGVLG